MSLAQEYFDQYDLRDWESIYRLLPPLEGGPILDLGCGVGLHSIELAKRGGQVIGLDQNPELIALADKLAIEGTSFHEFDARNIHQLKLAPFQGIWMSYTAAYFPQIKKQLSRWLDHLKPGGWMALTEASGILNHTPLSDNTRARIADFYTYSREKNYYDFEMGSRLRNLIKSLPLKIEKQTILEDREFSTQGPVPEKVSVAWESRLERMKRLQSFFGKEDFLEFKQEFLAGLKHERHVSRAQSHFYLLRYQAPD